MGNLQPAHRGYEFQDLMIAARSVDLLLGDLVTAQADEKLVKGDRFDDLTTVDVRANRERIQFKHRDADNHVLSLGTFTSDRRQLRFDKLVASAVADREGPGAAANSVHFRVLLRDGRPTDPELLHFLTPAPIDPGAFLPGLPTYRMQFDADAIWPDSASVGPPSPEGSDPFAFVRSSGLNRDDVAWLCERLTIEVEAPAMTGDLRAPGPAEVVLLNRAVSDVGAGQYPNEHRAPTDVAEAFISAARMARQGRTQLSVAELIARAQLRIDFGTVPHVDPVDSQREVQRASLVDELAVAATSSARGGTPLILDGAPGQGKSWTCKQLVDYLRDDGWLVAEHYCFLGAADNDREARVYTNHIFGTLLDRIAEAEPTLVRDQRPIFAADQKALENAVKQSLRVSPDRPVAVVVDGLDHVSRVAARTRTLDPSLQVAEELAALDLPRGSVLIVLSQPGDHLVPLLNAGATVIGVPGLSRLETSALIARLGAAREVDDGELSSDTMVDAVHARSGGNALYATYLCREVLLGSVAGLDAVSTVNSFPAYSGTLSDYYSHIYDNLGPEAAWVADLLPFLNFSVTPAEIREIRPDGAHHLDQALQLLGPVLDTKANSGRVRVYHESFARFIADQFDAAASEAINVRIAGWLTSKGFYVDERSYRFLLKTLAAAGKHSDVVELVSVAFLSQSVAAGFPTTSILNNLAVAVESASIKSDWPAIVRFIELARGASTYEYERLETVMVDFADVLIAVLGGEELTRRLLFEGQPVVPSRSGLQICAALDERGLAAPWQPYLNAFNRESSSDNTHYGADSDAQVYSSILRGQLRLETLRPRTETEADSVASGARWSGSNESLERLVEYIDSADLPADLLARPVLDTQGAAGTLAVAHRLATPAPFSLAVAQSLAGRGESDSPYLAQFVAIAAGPGRNHGSAHTLLDLGAPVEALFNASTQAARSRLLELTAAVQQRPNFADSIDEWIDLCSKAAIDDPVGLAAAEASITDEFWYRDWLRFVLNVCRAESASANQKAAIALDAIGELNRHVDPFAGDPRACDLYSIWKQVRDTIRRAVDLLDDDSWQQAIVILTNLSSSISTTLFGEMGGPFASDDLIRLAIDTGTSAERRPTVSALLQDTIDNDGARRYYNDLAMYRLFAARFALLTNDVDESERWWLEACQMLTGYGFHKDMTIFEILDPLSTLIEANPSEGRIRVSKVQALVERVPAHTDLKETRHAWSQWWDLLALADPEALSELIAPSMLRNCNLPPAFHEEAREELWRVWRTEVDPVIASLLRITFDLALDSADADELRRLLEVSDPPETLVAQLVSLTDNRPSTYAYSNQDDLLKKDAEHVADINAFASAADAPVITPWAAFDTAPREDDSQSRRNAGPAHRSDSNYSTSEPIEIAAGMLGLAHAARAWRKRPYEAEQPMWDATRFSNAIGYRLLDLAQQGREADAEFALRTVVEADRLKIEHDILPMLAAGLELNGVTRLAALAYAFSWTQSRGGGGWLSFGGKTHIELLRKAIQLDEVATLEVVAEEIQRAITGGNNMGLTQALIFAFALLDMPTGNENRSLEVAFEAWDEAFDVIAARAPWVHPWDDPDEPYSPPEPAFVERYHGSLEASFAAAILAGLANPGREQKRRTMLSVRLLMEYAPEIAGRELERLLPLVTDPATITWTLSLIDRSTKRSELLARCGDAIAHLRESELLTVRTLARRLISLPAVELPSNSPDPELLTGAGGHSALWIAPEVAARVSVSDPDLEEAIAAMAGVRLAKGEEILPGLGEAVVNRTRMLLENGEHRERFKHQLEAIGRADGNPDAYMASDEAVETALQLSAGGGRLAMIANGEFVMDPVSWENRLANAILGNPAIALDIESTRYPRPAIPTPPGTRASEWKDLSAKLANEETSTFDSVFRSDRAGIVIGTVSQDPRSCAEVLGGRYSGWKIIGSEEQRRIGRAGRNERGLLVQRFFGLEYRTSNDADGLDAPPLANASSAMWKLPLPESQIAGPIIGTQPFMGYDDRMELHDDSKDGLGIPHRLMVPTGWLREKWNLRTDPDRAFVLNDDAGPALALLTWRAEYERSDYHLPRRKLWGSAIAVRPDLLENLIGECGDELKLRDLIVGPAEILL